MDKVSIMKKEINKLGGKIGIIIVLLTTISCYRQVIVSNTVAVQYQPLRFQIHKTERLVFSSDDIIDQGISIHDDELWHGLTPKVFGKVVKVQIVKKRTNKLVDEYQFWVYPDDCQPQIPTDFLPLSSNKDTLYFKENERIKLYCWCGEDSHSLMKFKILSFDVKTDSSVQKINKQHLDYSDFFKFKNKQIELYNFKVASYDTIILKDTLKWVVK